MHAMKDSGLEWVGEVPESWAVRPHWSVMRESKTPVGRLHTELVLLSLTKQGVIVRDLEGGGKFPANFESYQQVKFGDLILCLFDVEETPRTVGLAPSQGMITSAYTIMNIFGIDPRFLEWYLIGMDNEKRFRPFYSGLRNTISKDVFGSIRFAVPPFDEQKEIVSFLNQETSQIDTLISKKERLIEKLLERRQALITHVVTKGLDPNAPMKDSGVEWLGVIPSSWSIVPLWSTFRRVKRTGYGDETLLSVYREHGVIPKDSRDDNHNVASRDLSTYQLVEVGDLAVNKMKAWQGSVSISKFRGIVSPAYFVFRPERDGFDFRFIHHLLRSQPYVLFYLLASKGIRTGQWDLRPEIFRNTPLLIPPFAEQLEIARHLDQETFQIDILVEKARQAIELLKERRQALITQVVTGKIDVRGFAGGNS